MARTSEEILATLRGQVDQMADLAYRHAAEVQDEKGDWRGVETAYERFMLIQKRLNIIFRLIVGHDGELLNDDGSPRTLAGEYAKLMTSMAILGDHIGALPEAAGRSIYLEGQLDFEENEEFLIHAPDRSLDFEPLSTVAAQALGQYGFLGQGSVRIRLGEETS